MGAQILVIDGVRVREEDAKARGLIGERPVARKSAAADVSATVEARVAVAVAEALAAKTGVEAGSSTPSGATELDAGDAGAKAAEAEAPVKPANKARSTASK